MHTLTNCCAEPKKERAANFCSLPSGLYLFWILRQISLLVGHRQELLAASVTTRRGYYARRVGSYDTIFHPAERFCTSLSAERGGFRSEEHTSELQSPDHL